MFPKQTAQFIVCFIVIVMVGTVAANGYRRLSSHNFVKKAVLGEDGRIRVVFVKVEDNASDSVS